MTALPFEQPLGAHPVDPDTVVFRVWAPLAARVELRTSRGTHPMAPLGHDVHEVRTSAAHGDDYWFVLDGVERADPCSRWQPQGISGPSRVLDPARLVDTGHRPRPHLDRAVLYEVHVGAFTAEGTFDSAIEHLPALADLGITTVEIMPVNEFPGRWGWGYDGVFLSAAQSSYGGPEALARFVRAAHDCGLSVLLDVVYNHLGPSGSDTVTAYGPYFTDRHRTDWGSAPNLDGPDCGPVREWILQSAEGWIRDFGIDGLRVDALHALVDGGARHLCQELTDRVRAVHPDALLVAESGLNDPRTVHGTDMGGWGFDADWADDFHHALRTLLTGERDGWYADYGSIGQLARAFEQPYLFAGDWVPFRRRRFGASADGVEPQRFVVFAQNHDQVGNRPVGDRLPPGDRPLAALCLLFSPATPMLFMGEEYGEDAPFPYFTDHVDPHIARATVEGRRREFGAFPGFTAADIPDPQDPATFAAATLTRRVDTDLADLYRAMLRLRRDLPPGWPTRAEPVGSHGLRVRRGDHELVANFGPDPLSVDVGAHQISVATPGVQPVAPHEHTLTLGPHSGAVVRLVGSDTDASSR